MKIGELAEQAGVSVQAVRYYERRRLLPAADRTTSCYREYAGSDVLRLRFIRRGKDLGFTLDAHGSPRTCALMHALGADEDF